MSDVWHISRYTMMSPNHKIENPLAIESHPGDPSLYHLPVASMAEGWGPRGFELWRGFLQ